MTVTNLFQVRTLTEELYTQLSLGASTDSPNLSGGTAWLFVAGLMLIGLSLGIGLLTSVRRPPRTALVFRLHRWRMPAVLLITVLLMIVIGLPLVSLVVKCGLAVRATEDGGRMRTWSLGKCLALMAASPVRFRREFAWSLTLATVAATVTTVIAAILAWQFRFRALGRWTTVLVITLGLTVPGPVIGLTLIAILDRPHAPISNWLYDQTVFAPIVALTIRGLPIAALILSYAISRLPTRLFELAAIDGASWSEQARWIVWPSTRPAIAAAWLAAFCINLGDVSATILVLPPGVDTIALRLFERLHFGAEDQVAGISLVLVGIFAGIGATLIRLLWRRDPG